MLARHATKTGEIQLQQRRLADGSLAFEIIVDGVFLMASYNQASERALAHRALDCLSAGRESEEQRDAVPAAGDFRLLVGGLGMGFTLQEALSDDRVTAVDVVELDPHVVEWNRAYFAPLSGHALLDPRVTLIQQDLLALLYALPPVLERYQAVLLDVDNGPSWLAHESNARLYTAEALWRWAAMLRPGGCLVVWSAQPEPKFLARLETVFSRVEEIPLIAVGSRREPVQHFIYQSQKKK